MPHHVKIRPVRLRRFEPSLGCETSRIVGYRAVCSCKARSKVEGSVRAVRAWASAHGRGGT